MAFRINKPLSSGMVNHDQYRRYGKRMNNGLMIGNSKVKRDNELIW